jgi:hypothetical protein
MVLLMMGPKNHKLLKNPAGVITAMTTYNANQTQDRPGSEGTISTGSGPGN